MTKDNAMQKSIMLIGSFSGGNYGDTIVLTSLLEFLEKNGFKTVYIPAANPKVTEEILTSINHGLIVHCIDVNMRRTLGYRFFNLNVIKRLRNVDYIGFTAGTMFFRDLLNPQRNFVFSVYLLLLFIKFYKVKILGLFVGINESLEKYDGLPRRVITKIFNSSSHIITRDLESFNNLKDLFPKIKISRSYDIAFFNLLSKASREPKPINKHINNGEKSAIGINVCEYLGTQVGKSVDIKLLENFLNSVTAKYKSVFWFHTTKRDEEFVKANILLIDSELLSKSSHLSLYQDSSLESEYSKLDFFVGMRMHSIIPSLTFGIPTVALNYNEKVKSLFSQLGGDQFVLDFDELVNEDISLDNGFVMRDDQRAEIIQNVYDIKI